MTVGVPAPETREEYEKQRQEILSSGLARGLKPAEVRQLYLLDQIIDKFWPRQGAYDQCKNRTQMISLYLRQVAKPTPLDTIATEIANHNSRFDRRAMWQGAVWAVSKGALLNVADHKAGEDWVIALPDWYHGQNKKKH
jgi:hypothetical protein